MHLRQTHCILQFASNRQEDCLLPDLTAAFLSSPTTHPMSCIHSCHGAVHISGAPAGLQTFSGNAGILCTHTVMSLHGAGAGRSEPLLQGHQSCFWNAWFRNQCEQTNFNNVIYFMLYLFCSVCCMQPRMPIHLLCVQAAQRHSCRGTSPASSCWHTTSLPRCATCWQSGQFMVP